MIHERTEEGRAVAKAEGRHLGGNYPFGYTPGVDGVLAPTHWRADALRYMKQLQGQGYGVRQIAKAVSDHYGKVSHTTVANILKENAT
jgi:DNA invertase Pin-like site-specific DNA recombinase